MKLFVDKLPEISEECPFCIRSPQYKGNIFGDLEQMTFVIENRCAFDRGRGSYRVCKDHPKENCPNLIPIKSFYNAFQTKQILETINNINEGSKN